MDPIATSNPGFAKGTQYRDYVDGVQAKAAEKKRARLNREGKTPGEIEQAMYVCSLSDFPRIERPRDGHAWGPWVYVKSNLTLIYAPADQHWSYEVDLERCNTSAQSLDWIFQVSNKHSRSAESVGHLIEALQDLLNPQANICSFGRDSQWSAAKYLLEGSPDRPLYTKHIDELFQNGQITVRTEPF